MKKTLTKILSTVTLLVALATVAPAKAEDSISLDVSNPSGYSLFNDILSARSNVLTVKSGGLTAQVESNADLFQNGEDFVNLSYAWKSGEWTFIGATRNSEGEAEGADPVREVTGIAKKGNLGLIAIKSLNGDFTKIGGWYTNLPVGDVQVDGKASLKYLGNGTIGQESAVGVHTDGAGAWLGYNTDDTWELVGVANTDDFGIYSFYQKEKGGDVYSLFRLGTSDGKPNGSYEMSSGLGTIDAFQGVPPFKGAANSVFADSVDEVVELGYVDNSGGNYLQVIVGKNFNLSKGKVGVGAGGKLDLESENVDPALELYGETEIKGTGVFGSVNWSGDTPLFRTGIKYSF